jgi:hypothetical protein
VHTFRVICRNYSRYARGIVWENAQDLEHVTYLHRRTNAAFRILGVTKIPGSAFEYDTFAYESTRKVLSLFRVKSFGFRRIVRPYQMHQTETIPIFGVTSALNSLLLETGDPARPTLLLDEVVVTVRGPLQWFEGFLRKSLQRHAAIQCAEDEPFRERRTQIAERGIKLPYTLLREPVETTLTSQFVHSLDEDPRP